MSNIDAQMFRELMQVYGVVLEAAKPGEAAFYANLNAPKTRQFCLELDAGWITIPADVDNLRQLIEHADEYSASPLLDDNAKTAYFGEKQEILDLVVNPAAFQQFFASSARCTLQWTKPYSSEVDRRGWLSLQDWLKTQP